jgi:hypothetical protein
MRFLLALAFMLTATTATAQGQETEFYWVLGVSGRMKF